MRGGTLDATIKLLCPAVRGIIQRKDPFVFELNVNDEQVSRLMEFEEIAKSKCAVTRTKGEIGLMGEAATVLVTKRKNKVSGVTVNILELVPHCECP